MKICTANQTRVSNYYVAIRLYKKANKTPPAIRPKPLLPKCLHKNFNYWHGYCQSAYKKETYALFPSFRKNYVFKEATSEKNNTTIYLFYLNNGVYSFG